MSLQRRLTKLQNNQQVKFNFSAANKYGRSTQHYVSIFAKNNDNGKNYRAYKLIGISNPYTPIYQIYNILVFPTTKLINKQIIQFIMKCWKHYQTRQVTYTIFEQEFFGKSLSPNPKLMELINIAKKIVLTPESKPQISQVCYQDLTIELRRVFKQTDMQRLKNKVKRNLDKFIVLTRAQKLAKLSQFCKHTHKLWSCEPYTNSAKTEYYIIQKTDQFENESTSMWLSLQQFVSSAQKLNINLSERILQSLSISILDQLNQLHNILQGRNKDLQFYYELNVDNIFIHLENKKQDEEFDMVKWTIDRFKPCRLEFMEALLTVIGVKSDLISIQSTLLAESTPKPPFFQPKFKTQLQKYLAQTQQQNSQPQPQPHGKIQEIQMIVRWILIIDLLFSKFLPAKNVQICANSNPSDKLRQIDTICQKSFSAYIIQTILYIKTTFCCSHNTIIPHLNFHEMLSIWNELPQEVKDHETSQLLKFKHTLYFSNAHLKDLFRQKQYIYMNTQKKLYCMYFLALYAIISSAKDSLKFENKDAKNKVDPPKLKIVGQFQAFIKKLKDLIDQSIKKGSSQEFKEFQAFYIQNKDKNFNAYYHIEPQKPKSKLETIQSIMDKLQTLMRNIFQQLQKQTKNDKKMQNKNLQSYSVCYKNICLFEMYMQVDRFNLTDLSHLYYTYYERNKKDHRKKQKIEQEFDYQLKTIRNVIKQIRNKYEGK